MFTYNSKLLKDYVSKKHDLPSNEELKELKELYKFLNKKYNSVRYKKDITKSISESESLSVEISSPFLSSDIQEKIKKFKKSIHLILSVSVYKININVYHSEDNIDKFLDTIVDVISFIFCLSDHNVLNSTINFYLCDDCKMMDYSKDYSKVNFDTHEVNSGSTFMNKNVMHIWRKEEIMKVTLHECIHLLDYDFKDYSKLLDEHYKRKYNITSSDLSIGEAYTEIWAELLNVFLITKYTGSDYNTFIKYIQYEKYFSKFQMAKIFYVKSINKKENDLNEFTNVLPYFIIKCEIFSDLQDFLQLCKTFNIDYIKVNKKRIIEYFYDLEKCNSYDKLFIRMDKKNYIYLTLRMSMLELNLF